MLEEQPLVAYVLFIIRQLGCLYVIMWTTINVGANNVARDNLKEAIKTSISLIHKVRVTLTSHDLQMFRLMIIFTWCCAMDNVRSWVLFPKQGLDSNVLLHIRPLTIRHF